MDGKFSDPNYNLTDGFLSKYLDKDNLFIIRHSLYTGWCPGLYLGDSKKFSFPFLGKFPWAIRYICELIVNLVILLYLHPKAVIAIDPLSAFIPTLLKKIWFIDEVFFLTPDFSRKRFANKYLNWIYFRLDRFCTQAATVNICNSQTVIDYKVSLYQLTKLAFFHLPNVPNPELIEGYFDAQKVKNRIIYVWEVSDHIDFIGLFLEIQKISLSHPDISLVVVGSGNKLTELISFVQDREMRNITFAWRLSFRETLAEIAKSELWIATYRGNLEYDFYRDSCKIREYQALGCIPITTRAVKSNTDEIERFGSGVIVECGVGISKYIELLINDRDKIERIKQNMRRNCEIYQSKFTDLFCLVNNSLRENAKNTKHN